MHGAYFCHTRVQRSKQNKKMKQQNSLVVVHVAAAEKVLYLALWAVNLRISACMTTTVTL
jgi:hypothetical protein